MRRNTLTVGLVALVLGLSGGALGTYVWLREPVIGDHGNHDEHGEHDDHHDGFERGPHGGRVLSEGDFALEVTIYEQGVPPQFRVYAFDDEKPVAADDIDLTIRLHRLGGRLDEFSFRAQGEYLLGDMVVEEPHSFDVEAAAQWRGKTSSWQYSQYEGRVVLSSEVAQQAGIEVREAGSVRIEETLALRGEISLNEDEVAHIVPRISGQVREVLVRLGDDVRAGDVLAVIDSRELAEAKAGDLAAEARLSLMRGSLERIERLFEKKIAPEEELLRARQELAEAEIEHRTAEAKLHALGLSEAQVRALHEEEDVDYSRYEIKAPFDATVIKKHLTLGEVVGPETDVFVLADLGTVWVDLAVYPKDAVKIRVGQPVTVSFRGEIPDSIGLIDYVTPIADEATRTATVRVVLENLGGQLRPGLFATAELVVNETTVPVAVGADAILTVRDGSVVFVNDGDTYEARPLELGRSDGRWVEINHGLTPGEMYVGKGSFILKAELEKAGATHAH